jgi:thiamine biosynthesis lipoprotein ApbE
MIDPRMNRRKFVALGVGALAAGTVPAVWMRRRRVVRRQVPVMGTIADLLVVHRDEVSGEAAIDAAIAELRWVDRTMTRFDDDSDIGRANLEARERTVHIEPATALVVDAG